MKALWGQGLSIQKEIVEWLKYIKSCNYGKI